MIGEVALWHNIANVDGSGIGVFGCAGTIVVEVASEPTGGAVHFAIGGGFPNFGRTEVAPAWIGVTNVLNNGEVAVIQEVAELAQGGVEGKVVVYRNAMIAN